MISLSWGVATDVGHIRKNNQDSYLADRRIFAVADGMGGHVGGEVASKLAIDVFSEAFSDAQDGLDVVEVAQDANSAILLRASKEPGLAGMGTTLCLLAVDESSSQLDLVNVGDSRAYLLRDGELFQLTDDHTLISEMVKSGELTQDQAIVHRARHILTRALGVERKLQVDHWKIDPKEGDLYLLCSDGLTNELGDPEIAQALSKSLAPERIAHDLVRSALDAGGSDNVTCIVVRVVEANEPVGGITGDGPRTVELPSQTKLRERLQSASHSVGADLLARQRVISANQLRQEREAKAREAKEGQEQMSDDATLGAERPLLRVSPPITSSVRSPALSAIPVPLPKRATEKKFRLGSILRISIFIILLLVVIAFGVSAVGVYADHSYYVGLDGTNLAVYQGRPGGLLWYNPTLVKKTQVAENQIAPYHLPQLSTGVVEPSLAASVNYINNLVKEESQISSSSPSPTSTSLPSVTTTTAVPGG